MTKFLCGLVLAAALVGGSVLPAGAAPPDVQPRQFCLDVEDTRATEDGELTAFWVPIRYPMFGNEVMELPIVSLAGCISTVARGLNDLRATGAVSAEFLSVPAARSQCILLEQMGITYPYAFYGVYLAERRSDCVQILLGFHTGALAPPPEHPEEPPVDE